MPRTCATGLNLLLHVQDFPELHTFAGTSVQSYFALTHSLSRMPSVLCAQDYPELYGRALESTKSKPAPNKTLVSDWGDALKQCVRPAPLFCVHSICLATAWGGRLLARQAPVPLQCVPLQLSRATYDTKVHMNCSVLHTI